MAVSGQLHALAALHNKKSFDSRRKDQQECNGVY